MINERHGNGQPFAIKKTQREIMCKALRDGMSFRQASAAAGIRPVAAEEWMVKAGDPLRSSKYTRPDEELEEPYISFAAEIRKAIADAERTAVKAVRREMGSDWKAAAWWLEHNSNVSADWKRPETEKEASDDQKPSVQIVLPAKERMTINAGTEFATVEFVSLGDEEEN
jgi:hypothetical protein